METPEKQQLANDQPTSWLDSTAAKLAGAGAALAATLLTARVAISNAFFKTMNKESAGTFHDLQKKRDEAIAAVTAPAKENIPVFNAMDRVREINREYDSSYKHRRQLLNINGVFDEMKALKRHQWFEVLFATGAVASVAVGAIIAIASSRDAARKEDRIVTDIEKGGRGA